jgi:hypothetical protein
MDPQPNFRSRTSVIRHTLLFYSCLPLMLILFESCEDKCEMQSTYVVYNPIYTPIEEIRSSIELIEPQPIKGVGKIYYKDGFLFVNEPGAGIHIIDNHDPAAPEQKGFLKIPGNYELAIKGNTLYADSYLDLVAVNVSNPSNITEINRLENIFMSYSSFGYYFDPALGVITGWEETTETVTVDACDLNTEPMMYCGDGVLMAMSGSEFARALSSSGGSSVIGNSLGIGGSMARFTISGNYLYALDAGNVIPVDVSNETNPITKDKVFVAWDIETIFPYKKNLFLGSSGGMHILDIEIPATPTPITTYEHIRSCDPVVADGDFAYVTLRSGSACQGFTNQLEVIDISNLTAPQLVKTYPMNNPHGLGKAGNTLFICDGDAGLKIFDATDVGTIDKKLLAQYDSINAYDVIPLNGVLMMIGADGIFQYDYSNTNDIKLLSSIVVTHE